MTIKQFIAGSILALTLGIAPCGAQTTEVGVMNFTYEAPHRDRLVQTTLFYPAEKGGYPEWIGDNLAFKGTRVMREAKPEKGKHPLIIISHGSGGSAPYLGWLANRLVAQGFIVAAPNHQGSTSADSTPETTIPAVWERPADISILIDALSASASISAIADMNDITALGFSLGGQTVLSLAGVKFQAAGLARYCDENFSAMECVWFDEGNELIPGHVDLHKIDASRFDVSHPDSRISRIIAIDPAYVPSIDGKSLNSVNAKVQIINLGLGQSIPLGVKADEIAKGIQGAQYETVSDASHFDFLSQCKGLGWFFIWMEGDDAVCTQSRGRSRAEIHDEIATKILAFLKLGQI